MSSTVNPELYDAKFEILETQIKELKGAVDKLIEKNDILQQSITFWQSGLGKTVDQLVIENKYIKKDFKACQRRGSDFDARLVGLEGYQKSREAIVKSTWRLLDFVGFKDLLYVAGLIFIAFQ